MPVLSICIPTLNRGAFIGETLCSITSQATDEVEIVVVDGGSKDNTETVVRQYQQRFSHLRYFRSKVENETQHVSPSNMGFDRDCTRAVELAQGEYCWLFTDDDILKPGAIKVVLDAVRQGFSLVVVNAEVRDATLAKRLSDHKLAFFSDRVYEDNNDDKQKFLAEVGEYLSFLGSVVIRREIWLTRDRSKYFGSGFVHVGVILQKKLPGRILALATPRIIIRLGTAEWTSRSFEIWLFQWPELIWSFSDYSDASKRAVCRQYPWQRVGTLIIYRALGVYSSDKYSRLLKERLHLGWKQVLGGMIARMPVCVARAIARVYYLVRQNKMMLYFLQASLPMIIKK